MQMKPLLAILAACLFVSSDSAQIFPNAAWNRTRQVGSSCPGGLCPTAASVAAPSRRVLSAPFKALSNGAGHWSYPGDINSHLESTHGVSTAGMSREEKLNLHDSLHENGGQVVSVPRANRKMEFTGVVEFYPSVSKAGYGSFGSRSSGYGSSGSAYGRDYDGAVITSLGPLCEASPVAAPALPEAMESRRSRKASREAILESVCKAESEGSITATQADEIRRAAKRPRMLAQMESLIAEKAKAEGYALPMGSDGEVQMGAIPWADLADFITKIAPLIFKLIDLFSADIDTGIFKMEQFVKLETVPQAYPDEWYNAA
jgi:hypothetical protein